MCLAKQTGMRFGGAAGRINQQRDKDIRDTMRSSYDMQMGMSPAVNFSRASAVPREDDGPRMSVPTPSPVRQGIREMFGDVDVGRTVGTGDDERVAKDPNNPYQKFMNRQRSNFDRFNFDSPVTTIFRKIFGADDGKQMTTRGERLTGQIFRQAAANPGTVNLTDDGLGLKIDVPKGTINLSDKGFATYTGVLDPDYDGVFSEIVNPPVEEGDENTSSTKAPFDPCPEGFKFNPNTQQCEQQNKAEDTSDIGTNFVRNTISLNEAFPDLTQYGRQGGEFQFFKEMPGVKMNKGGIARGPQGEVTGPGGPKDDLVGPFMLSSQEYVLPYEMVLQEGGGSYDRGIKSLERERMAALKKYKDRVASS